MKLGIKRHACLYAIAAATSGCATFTDYKADQYGQGVNDREAAACEMQAEQSRTNHGYDGLIGSGYMHESFNRVYDACMRAKGYQRKP